MINTDEDALICDFAETYHIYDYRSLPLHMAGIFACGLRPDSRIGMAIIQIETNNRPDVTCNDIRQHKDVSMAQQL